jgi:hypothetical protein
MENKFDPIKNAPITLEVFDNTGKSIFKTKSVNKASDKSVLVGEGARIVATDSKGNVREF